MYSDSSSDGNVNGDDNHSNDSPVRGTRSDKKKSMYQKSALLGSLVDSVDFYEKILE